MEHKLPDLPQLKSIAEQTEEAMRRTIGAESAVGAVGQEVQGLTQRVTDLQTRLDSADFNRPTAEPVAGKVGITHTSLPTVDGAQSSQNPVKMPI